MDLRNWEHYADTGSPVNGATVEAREAGLTSPNVSAVLASTTTNSDGMWAFTGLSDTPKDIKVTYSGQTWWYKGLSRYSASAIFSTQSWGGALQYPLTRNGGVEGWGSGVGPTAIGASPVRVADLWSSFTTGGSSATVTKEVTIVAPDSAASAKLVHSKVGSGTAVLYYQVPVRLVPSLKGKDVAFSVQVRQGVASSSAAFIADGVGSTASSTSATTGSFVTLSCTRTLNAAATLVQFGIIVSLSDTVYLDDAIAELGTTIPTFVPNPLDAYLAEEWVAVDPTVVATANQNTLQNTLDAIVGRLKAIAGTTNWYDAIAVAVTGKVSKAGDTMSGALIFNNNIPVQAKETGGVGRSILYMDTFNQVIAGVATNSLVLSGSLLNFFDGFGVRKVWHEANDGAGSTLDADTVDGAQLSQLVRNDATSTLNNAVAIQGKESGGTPRNLVTMAATDQVGVGSTANQLVLQGSSIIFFDGVGSRTVWHSNNDGSGSGLDADLLDGQNGTFFQARVNHTGVQAPATISPQGAGSGLDADTVDGINPSNSSGAIPLSNGTVNANLNADMTDGFHASATATANTIPVGNGSGKVANGWLNTGSGNGLDADTVDGSHASAFATSGHTHSANAIIGSGTYAGTGGTKTVNSLGFTPKFVWIHGSNSTGCGFSGTEAIVGRSGSPTATAVTSLIAGGFTIDATMSVSGQTYDFMAVG